MKTASAEIARVTFLTDDGVRLVGDFCRGRGDGPTALLLHMMPATKESWSGLGQLLVGSGFSVLAIDLRGHGESVEGPAGRRLDYRTFTDAEHQSKILDVATAVRWLGTERGEAVSPPVIVGASIGANLAIAYAGDHHEIPAVAALSPGLDYRGITTADRVRQFAPGQSLFLVASEEDERSFPAVRELARLKPDARLKEYRGAGHGTKMFDSEPALMTELAAWLNEHAGR
jgi:pimeloyl-ACP methyl ester carboxylesterase